MKIFLQDFKKKAAYSVLLILFITAILLLFYSGISKAQSVKITFSEINYKSDKSIDSEDWVELWNYGNETVNLSGWKLGGEKFNEFFEIPANIVLEPDGRIVLSRDNEKFKDIYPDVAHIGPFVFRLSGKGQAIRLFDQSNSLYLQVNYKDSLPWPKTPDGHGKTLELRNPEGNINDGNNWFAGCIGGSPGKAYSSCSAKIIFSEINYTSGQFYDAGDWVEIRNISNEDVNMSGWKFSNRNDSNEFFIPSNTIIKKGENLVLARRNKFSSVYPWVNVAKPFGFAIRGHREILRLYDKNGKIHNSVFYHNEAPWPLDLDESEKTLEIKDEKGILCDGSNWFEGCKGGSPGIHYNEDCILSVEQIAEHFSLNIYPNPFTDKAKIELVSNRKNYRNASFELYDFTGKILMQKEINLDNNGESIIIEINRNNLQSGIYMFSFSCEGEKISSGKLAIN
jgi:hypothetical protein